MIENKCNKCTRYNSLVEIKNSSINIDGDTLKKYYSCTECNNIQVEIENTEIQNNSLDKWAIIPDLWWEKEDAILDNNDNMSTSDVDSRLRVGPFFHNCWKCGKLFDTKYKTVWPEDKPICGECR